MKRTLVELRSIAGEAVRLVRQHDGTACLVLAWNHGVPVTPVALMGEVDPGRDMVRMLREVADQLERSKGQLVT